MQCNTFLLISLVLDCTHCGTSPWSYNNTTTLPRKYPLRWNGNVYLLADVFFLVLHPVWVCQQHQCILYLTSLMPNTLTSPNVERLWRGNGTRVCCVLPFVMAPRPVMIRSMTLQYLFKASLSGSQKHSLMFPSITAVTQPFCVQWSNNGRPRINLPPMRYVARRVNNISTVSSSSNSQSASHAERCMGESGWEYTDSGEIVFVRAASKHSSEAEMPTDEMGWTSVHHQKICSTPIWSGGYFYWQIIS